MPLKSLYCIVIGLFIHVTSYGAAIENTPIVSNPSKLMPVLNVFQTMQSLRSKGKLDLAIELGEKHIKNYSQDSDVLLLLGLIFYQQQKFSKASIYLNHVLKISPNYLDAKLGLINVALAQHDIKQAEIWLSSARKQAPENVDVKKIQEKLRTMVYQNKIAVIDGYIAEKNFLQARKLVLQLIMSNLHDVNIRLKLGNIYVLSKDYTQARQTFEYLLRLNDHNKQAYIGLIHVDQMSGHDRRAMSIAEQALLLFPGDPDIQVEQAKIYAMQHKYAKAADLNKKIMHVYPKNSAAATQLKEIKSINPHFLYGMDEVGFNTQVDSISDLKNDWEYSTVYYNRDTSWGSFSLNLNNADRFGTNANQGLLSVSPVINKNLYFRLTGAYANEPVLFPTYLSGVEGYFSGMPVELSAGYTYASILPDISYFQYTGSISKEWKDYWLSFRPNFYVPKRGKNSILYTGTLIRYLGFKDIYARVTVGSGTSPDLANLTTTDFIVIKNNFITVNIQFSVISHSVLLTLGGEYQHWVFPTNRVRRIAGGNIGLNYRFEGIT